MEIIEGIHRVDEASANMAHANVYLIIDGEELAVIDTGTSGNAQKTVKYIQKLGHQPSDVKTIILTPPLTMKIWCFPASDAAIRYWLRCLPVLRR